MYEPTSMLTIHEGFLWLQWCAHNAFPQVLLAKTSHVFYRLGVYVVEHAVEGEVSSEGVLLGCTECHLRNSVGSIANVGLGAQVDKIDVQLVDPDFGCL